VPYQAAQATSPYQQNRNSMSNANSAMPQQNNIVQTTKVDGNMLNQPYQQPSSMHFGQQNQSYGESNQPLMTNSNAPIVETVTDVDQQGSSTSQFQQAQFTGQQTISSNVGLGIDARTQPASNVGLGIDARTQPETPEVQAAKAVETVPGAPNCADGRKPLLESALRCELPKYLIDSVLENPNLAKVKDAASVKVHAVELLKLLTQDPGYGLKFKLVLEEIPAWKKYASQDHSLFITGHEQKADYFLTDGSSSLEAKKLLTNN
jgi:hypothetical protein